MDQTLIDDDSLSPERRSILPGTGFFVPDDLERGVQDEQLRPELATAETIVLADPDADGLACVALLQEAFSDVTFVPAGPHELSAGLELIADAMAPDGTVMICDLAPDSFADLETPLSTIVRAATTVRWFDHHQWDDSIVDAVRDLGVDLVLGTSDEECTADVVQRSLTTDFPDHLQELTAVTRDHDLWIKEDPRSDDLADFARWSDDEDTYIETVAEYGPDLPDDVMAMLTERRKQKADLIDRAVRRAEFHDIGPWTVAITYGRCSQNEVAEALRADGADAAAIVKPAGSASIRGSETFTRSHEVAQQLNGGGHPKAAGCKPDIYADMLDYAHHWTTRGATAKQLILDAFRSIAPD